MVNAAGSSSVLPMCHEFDVVRTKFMRSKLEYLLNKCAEHTGGCSLECTPFRNVQVVQVDRVQNHPLWERFAAGRANRPEHCGKIWVEESRPIDCDVSGNDEQFLFHGTSPKAVSKIIVDGFRMGANDTLRYGRCISLISPARPTSIRIKNSYYRRMVPDSIVCYIAALQRERRST